MSTPSPLDPLLAALAASRKGDPTLPAHRLATVTSTAGGLQLMFDGETSSSGRSYPRLDSYTPAVPDRVLLAQVGTTWVVLGKIV